MLSWSTIEFQAQLKEKDELSHALEAIKWGTDYLIKAHPEPHVLYGQVGDGDSDHPCWQRPEDMTTPRPAYRIDEDNPGADLAAETAAAFAAASLVFKPTNEIYASLLLTHAKQVYLRCNIAPYAINPLFSHNFIYLFIFFTFYIFYFLTFMYNFLKFFFFLVFKV